MTKAQKKRNPTPNDLLRFLTHSSFDGLLVHPLGCMMNESRESPNCACQQIGLVLCCLITICLILYLLPPSKLSYEQWESAPLSNIHSQESDIECTKQPNPGGRRRGRWVGRKQSTSPNAQATEARVGWVGENNRQARHDQAYKPATRTQPELSQLPQSTSHKYSRYGYKVRHPLRLKVQVDRDRR